VKKRRFHVVIERDEAGMFVADVPALPGCATQAPTLEELRENIREAILLYLEDGEPAEKVQFVGVEEVEVQA
jgi:predicted RNase H-like HicB family nuclease